MNQNRRVVHFTLIATLLLLGAAAYAELTGSNILSLQNVSVLSAVFKQPPGSITPGKESDPNLPPPNTNPADSAVAGLQHSGAQLEVYQLPRVITHFGDTSQPSLPLFMQKLLALKKGGKGKIRIAWLGDSMIEGDLLTQTMRRRLQQEFGGKGVGFVSMQSAVAGFRTTVRHQWSGDWKEESFKSDTHTMPLFLSGHVYTAPNGSITVTDATSKDTLQTLVKSLICGSGAGSVTVVANGRSITFNPAQALNRIVLDSSASRSLSLQISNPTLPVYGVSLEPASGVVIDNFSFRGISGVELARVDTNVLHSAMQNDPYDLVVLEYGANLMFRPDDMDYSWFEKKMQPILAQLRRAMPGAEFLLVSTADRAFRYDGEWKTAVGIDNLVQEQARMAQRNNTAFYNLYQSMGGNGTVVRWADSSTALANKDYIHPNHAGAEILGNMLFDAFMADYRKAVAPKATAAK